MSHNGSDEHWAPKHAKDYLQFCFDNSALMRNIRRHENSLEGSIVSIARAVIHASRSFGEGIPDEGEVRVQFDDSIIQDTAAEKGQDLCEVGVTIGAWKEGAMTTATTTAFKLPDLDTVCLARGSAP